MRVPRSAAVVAAVLLTLGLGACGKSKTSSTSTSSSSAPAGTGTTAAGASTTAPASSPGAIAIQGFKFVPSPATAKVGDTITVTNKDGTDHSFTANDGSFDTGVFSSGSKTITLTKAGTFSVHCKIHNFMTGSITVS